MMLRMFEIVYAAANLYSFSGMFTLLVYIVFNYDCEQWNNIFHKSKIAFVSECQPRIVEY